MAKDSPLLTRLGGLVAAKSIRSWMHTMEYRGMFYDRALDPMYGCDSPRIYVFWHEYILVPLYLRGNCDLAMLLSKHRDAEDSRAGGGPSGLRLRARIDQQRFHRCTDGPTAARTLYAPDHHTRRTARAATQTGGRADLPGFAVRSADCAAGLRHRPTLAYEELGPLRRAATILANSRHCRAGGPCAG